MHVDTEMHTNFIRFAGLHHTKCILWSTGVRLNRHRLDILAFSPVVENQWQNHALSFLFYLSTIDEYKRGQAQIFSALVLPNRVFKLVRQPERRVLCCCSTLL